LTATSSGTKVTQIGAKVAGNNVATLVLIFITDTAGANPKLFDEIALPAVTASNQATSQRQVNVYSDLQLKAGQIIKVGATVVSGGNINIFAVKGDY
jgi:hypothetical protein